MLPTSSTRTGSPASESRPESALQLFLRTKAMLVAKPESIVITTIPRSSGAELVESLEGDKEIGEGTFRFTYNALQETFTAVMPTGLHNSPQGWFQEELLEMFEAGFLTWEELKSVEMQVGTDTDHFVGAYAGSIKQPDITYRPIGQILPTICCEAGFSESYPSLVEDMRLWLLGTKGTTNTVILLKFNKRANNCAAGYVEVYVHDTGSPEGYALSVQRTDILHEPGQQPATISLTRRQLFGDKLPLDRNPNDVWKMSLCRLLPRVQRAVATMGLTLVHN